ncbi:M24 family metallopeptidase, partial [Bacillus cereus]
GTVTAPIKPYAVSPMRPVPKHIERPHYVGRPAPDPYTGSHVQSEETIEKMRIAGRIAAQAMAAAAEAIKPGVTTDEIDRVGHE